MYKTIDAQDGKSVFLIEVTPLEVESFDQSKLLRGSRDLSEHALTNLRQVGEAIVQTCEDVSVAVRARLVDAAPDELEIKFGVSLSGEAGVPLIGKAKADSTFEVRAKWTR
ncbi:CU044_2847 family protein [Phaeacidiphilus oryzae]|uniref:CU044_2847 family protein n=1 Tax=Phaeacidiphilus oryzae TaxID=348818 RepID=UPI001269BD5C|nr:CU044_2847 family protein [Phaeacidiphilus oryzae]